MMRDRNTVRSGTGSARTVIEACSIRDARQHRASDCCAPHGEARLADVFRKAGFRHFRRAAQTPFNLIFEARR